MMTASMDINCFIIQLSTQMAPEKSPETNSRMRLVTGDDDNYQDYKPQLFDSAYERN